MAVRRALAWVTVAAACAAAAPTHAQDGVRAVVDRASAYVTDYRAKLAMVVAQERYDQEVRYPAPPGSRMRDVVDRVSLQSDFLLVRNTDGTLMPFRDVFERNGTAVRDREERLTALLLDNSASSLERAERIKAESARYNLGSIDRTINVPTLALEFLTAAHRDRLDFSFEGNPSATGVRVVRYQEVRGPTAIRTTNNGDLPVSGRYWISEETGRVERTELKASDAAMDVTITVTYRADQAAGLWVPDRMDEQYAQKNDRSEIRGTAVYTRYRRFSVTTSDEVNAPSQ